MVAAKSRARTPAGTNKGGGHLRDQEFYALEHGDEASQSARTIFHAGLGAGGDVGTASRRRHLTTFVWGQLDVSSLQIPHGVRSQRESGREIQEPGLDVNVLSMQIGSSGKKRMVAYNTPTGRHQHHPKKSTRLSVECV
jgi:hypothetical protein